MDLVDDINWVPAPNFVDDEAGPQCKKCTHYEDEHLEGKHCIHLMAVKPMNKAEKEFSKSKFIVFTARKLCDCKEFEK